MTSKKVVELFYDVVSPYSWLGFEVCSSPFVFKRLRQRFCCGGGGLCAAQAPWRAPLCSCVQVMCRYRHVWNIDLKLRPAFLGGVMQGSGAALDTSLAFISSWNNLHPSQSHCLIEQNLAWTKKSKHCAKHSQTRVYIWFICTTCFIRKECIVLLAVVVLRIKTINILIPWTLNPSVVFILSGNKPPGLVPNKFLYMTTDLDRLAKYFKVPLQSPSDPFEAMFQKGLVLACERCLFLFQILIVLLRPGFLLKVSPHDKITSALSFIVICVGSLPVNFQWI